ncbi:hypothetical protein XENOCAPTIV_023645, partial [Xenoophorus captivus]
NFPKEDQIQKVVVCALLQDKVKEEALASLAVGVLTVVNENAQLQGLNAVHLQPISNT